MSRLANAAIVVSALLLTLSTGRAQAQYRFENWNTDNGLPQNGVRGVGQMPDGYLWFTTFDGLLRFDGVRFTVFGLAAIHLSPHTPESTISDESLETTMIPAIFSALAIRPAA